MSILDRLSSRVGDRTEDANRRVALQCLDDPELLAQIVEGLKSPDPALVGDCAEVLTKVAEKQPDWVAPYAGPLSGLLTHKTTRVRWEAMHALALIAALAPREIDSLLPLLGGLICGDPSVIVRDHAADAIGNYAASSKPAAEKAYPLLMDALTAWEGKHAAHALKGLANVAMRVPALRSELGAIARKYAYVGRAVVRRAARELLKATEAISKARE